VGGLAPPPPQFLLKKIYKVKYKNLAYWSLSIKASGSVPA